MGRFEWGVGLLVYRVRWMGVGRCWSSPPAGSLAAGWLVKLGQVGEGPGVLPRY